MNRNPPAGDFHSSRKSNYNLHTLLPALQILAQFIGGSGMPALCVTGALLKAALGNLSTPPARPAALRSSFLSSARLMIGSMLERRASRLWDRRGGYLEMVSRRKENEDG